MARVNRRLTPAEAELATAFHEHTLESRTCAVCGYQGIFLEAHHAIPKSFLRREGFPEEVVYDPRNGLSCCNDYTPLRCHSRHELHVRRIPRSALPPSVFEFAAEHGLMWRLDRDYPEEVAA